MQQASLPPFVVIQPGGPVLSLLGALGTAATSAVDKDGFARFDVPL